MSSTITWGKASSFTINNKSGKIRRLSPQPTEDILLIGSSNLMERTKSEIESLVVSATQPKVYSIDYYVALREPLIFLRDKILDNPLSYFNPFRRKRLREIDSKLDEIDLKIYVLESQEGIKESDLKTVIVQAEARLTECLKQLKK